MRWYRITDRLRELFGLPPGRRAPDEPVVPPPPRVELALQGAVPGALIRLAPAVLLLVCTLLAGAGTGAWVLAGTGAVLVTWRPQWPVPAVFLVLVGLWVLAGPDLLGTGSGPQLGEAADGGLLRVSALALGLHLAVRSGALAAHVSWRTAVEVPVLGRIARSVLGVQVVVQSLVLGVVWLRSGLGGVVPGQEWLRLVAVLAVVLVAALVIPRTWLLRRPRPTRT